MHSKLTARALQARETRARLLEVSAALLGVMPYDRVTIAAICRESGVAVGTFYLYFGSKRELLAELNRQISEELAARFAFDPQMDACANYENYLRTYLETLRDHGVCYIRTLVQAMINEGFSDVDASMPRHRDILLAIYEKGRREGVFVNERIAGDAFYRFFFVVINGIQANWFTSGEAMDVVAFGMEAGQWLMDALKRP